MTTPALLVLLLVGSLLVWKVGSVVLRILGVAFFLIGMLSIALLNGSASKGEDLLLALAGMVLWLAGHWLFAFRHHVYRSSLARRFFVHFLSGRLDPTRNWGIRTIPAEPVLRTPKNQHGLSSSETSRGQKSAPGGD
jgi:hypothetical protein